MNHEVIVLTGIWASESAEVAELWRELQDKYKFNLQIIDVGTKEGARLMDRYKISSVPATIIDKEAAFIGMPDIERVEELLEKD